MTKFTKPLSQVDCFRPIKSFNCPTTRSNSISVMAQASASPSNLLIVGPGVLGSYAGKLWIDDEGPGSVVGQTNTTTNHPRLTALGIHPRTKQSASSQDTTFPNVLFAAPPSGSENYPQEVTNAIKYWDGTGSFVFTSSAAVYSVDDGSPANEDTPLVPRGNERTDKLLLAEQAVLDAGGCVVRLVGLYHRTRGAHTFFLKQGKVDRWGGYLVNLIHYEDAASMCHAVLTGQGAGNNRSSNVDVITSNNKHRSRVFIGCDGHPITFEDMIKAVEKSGELPGSCTFTGAPGGPSKGKKMSNEKSRKALGGWEPKYGSFEEFMVNHGGRDWYYENSLSMIP